MNFGKIQWRIIFLKQNYTARVCWNDSGKSNQFKFIPKYTPVTLIISLDFNILKQNPAFKK